MEPPTRAYAWFWTFSGQFFKINGYFAELFRQIWQRFSYCCQIYVASGSFPARFFTCQKFSWQLKAGPVQCQS